MTIETDADRLGVMADSSVTLVHSGTDYTVISSESDGLTLDSGTATDGTVEVQINTSSVTGGGISEGDAATLLGDAYTIAKIDILGGGMTVLYLEP